MLELREATYDDHAGVMALFQEYGLATRPFTQWRRQWATNPLVTAQPGVWPIGWLLKQDEDIVGFFGSIPMAYELGGRRLSAAVAHSWVVASSCRTHSLELIGRYFAQTTPDFFLDTTASPLAAKIFKAFGAKEVPVPDLDSVHYWITDYPGFVGSVFHKKGWPLGSLLKYPAGAALAISAALSQERTRPRSRAGRIIHLSAFDERFDIFWGNLRRAYPERLLFVRDRSWLDWHFGLALTDGRARVLVCEQDGQMAGYAIMVERETEILGYKRSSLVDIQVLSEADTEVVLDLVATGLRLCMDRRVHALEVVGLGEWKSQVLSRLSPRTRPLTSCPYLYRTGEEELGRLLALPTTWDPSMTDGDASL